MIENRELTISERVKDLSLSDSERVKKWGHRAYIGGPNEKSWYENGRRQYHFLISRGLKPYHVFFDIACGSLRLGQYLIPFLEQGHYYGIDSEPSLIQIGLREELLFEIEKFKHPNFACNGNFDFSFIEQYDFAIAQSLFTHLTEIDVQRCFKALRPKAKRNSQFYFTFFEGNSDKNPAGDSHANKNWRYSFQLISDIASGYAFDCTFIGSWGHENDQKIVLAQPSRNSQC